MSDAVNLRIDPRTGEKNWTDFISEELDVAEFDELPGVFGVLLTQVPHPTEINVYKATDPSVPLTRIFTTGEPSSSQFWSDSQQLKPRGYIIVNDSLDGETLIIIYKGGGYLAHKRVLETVIPEGPPGPPGGVDTVFTRSGDVVAETGDYTQDQVTDGSTYKQYSATEKTKLSGIATGADVTNTAINATNKATFHDNDRFAGANSESSNATVYWLWSAIKTALASFFAPQLCKAWVNFNPNGGSPTIRSSYNVASITYSAAGKYRVNFSSALANANYAVVGTASKGAAQTNIRSVGLVGDGYYATDGFDIEVRDPGSLEDVGIVCVAVFGTT